MTLVNIDNDTSGFVYGNISDNISENGSISVFTVRLDSRPIGLERVVIIPSSSDVSEGTIEPNILIFSNSNWQNPQTVTVSGINDDIDDDNQTITIFLDNKITANNFVELVTTDPKYIPPSSSYNGYYPYNPSVYDNGSYRIQLINVDDDNASIEVSSLSDNYTTESGGTSFFTIRLTSEPLGLSLIHI